MKYYIIAIAMLLCGCGSTATTATDEHLGHDHSKAEATDEHLGHDHSKAEATDEHSGHDHAKAEATDEHLGHDHSKAEATDEHSGHDHAKAEATDEHLGHDHGPAQSAPKAEPQEEQATDEIVFTPTQAKAVGLEVQTVQLAPFESVIKCTGQILGAQGSTYSVVATSSGIINLPQTTLSLGRKIGKGEVVATITSAQITGGDVSSKITAEYNKAKKEWQRASELVKDKVISQKDFDQIELDYKTAKIAYEALGTSSQHGGVRVNAPITGYITQLAVANGAYVEQGALIASIAQNESLELKVDVPQKWSNSLSLVTSANFRPAYSDKTYQLSKMGGKLLSYSRSTATNSPYIPLTFSFSNRDGIVSGAYAEVYVLLRSTNDVICVPLTALTESQGSYSVFVQLDAECYEKRMVSLGATDGQRIEILSGLTAGQTVVTKAAYQVKMAASSSAIPDGHNH